MPQNMHGAEIVTAHRDVHSEQGALRGEHPGRSKNPVIKVRGLAWLEFEKRDLDRAEAFARDFGFIVHTRTPQMLQLRAARAGAPCVVIRKGRESRFLGAAFEAADKADLQRLATATGTAVSALTHLGSGHGVSLVDPSGVGVTVVHGVEPLPATPARRR